MCEFWEHGPTGQHQNCHAMCVLNLNIIIEKLYLILWFWYVFVIIMSLLAVTYRMLSFSTKYLRLALSFLGFGIRTSDYSVHRKVISTTTVSEYFLLQQFSKNVNPAINAYLLEALSRNSRKITDNERLFMEGSAEDILEPHRAQGGNSADLQKSA